MGLEWLYIIALAIQLIQKTDFDDHIQVQLEFGAVEKVLFVAPDNIPVLYVDLVSSPDNRKLAGYVLIPWQNLYSVQAATEDSIQASLLSRSLITVTGQVLVYRSLGFETMTPEEAYQVERFNNRLSKLFEVDRNQQMLHENRNFSIPHGWQIIALREYPHYNQLEVALPGSKQVQPFIPEELNPDKMLHVRLIPETGEIKEQWLIDPTRIQSDSNGFNRYIVPLTRQLIEEALKKPDSNSRIELFERGMAEAKALAETLDPGFSNQIPEYTEQLKRLLNITAWFESPETLFGDYQPKLTRDELTDYRSSLSVELEQLPESTLPNLPLLIKQFRKYHRIARKEHGTWVEGNMVLGAKAAEYEASDAELILAEIGKKIAVVVGQSHPEDIRSTLRRSLVFSRKIHYREFTFEHADVMGSGRFFYIDEIIEREVQLVRKGS